MNDMCFDVEEAAFGQLRAAGVSVWQDAGDQEAGRVTVRSLDFSVTVEGKNGRDRLTQLLTPDGVELQDNLAGAEFESYELTMQRIRPGVIGLQEQAVYNTRQSLPGAAPDIKFIHTYRVELKRQEFSDAAEAVCVLTSKILMFRMFMEDV